MISRDDVSETRRSGRAAAEGGRGELGPLHIPLRPRCDGAERQTQMPTEQISYNEIEMREISGRAGLTHWDWEGRDSAGI